MMAGPANKHTANDNTSGVITLTEIMQSVPKELRDSVVRLCLSLELGVEEPVLRSITEKAAAEDLRKMKASLEIKMAQLLPGMTQLKSAVADGEGLESGFMI